MARKSKRKTISEELDSSDKSSSEGDGQDSDSGVFEENPPGKYPCKSNPVELANFAKAEFNKNRKIIIRNIPPVKYEEIKDFLKGAEIADIEISKKSRHAIVILKNGENAEKLVSKHHMRKLLGTQVELALYPLVRMLCVSNLPKNIQEEAQFAEFLQEYGPLEKSFLMRNAQGDSKGYGFVEFAHNREKVSSVKEELDGLLLTSSVTVPLHCEFVKENVLHFEHLHSRCLLVSNLPDISSGSVFNKELFEAKFGEIHNPSQCKLVYKNGREYLNCGVVQYANPTHAENVKTKLHNTKIDTKTIHVTYFAPGFNKIKEMLDRSAQVTQKKKLKKKKPAVPKGLPKPDFGAEDGAATGGGGSAAINLAKLTAPIMHTLLSQNPAVLEIYQQVLQQLQVHVIGFQSAAAAASSAAEQGKPQQLPTPLMDTNTQIAVLAVLMAKWVQQDQPRVFASPLVKQAVFSEPSREPQPSPDIQRADGWLNNLVTKPGVTLKSPMRRDKKTGGSAAAAGESQFRTAQGSVALNAPPMHSLLQHQELDRSSNNHFGEMLLALQNPLTAEVEELYNMEGTESQESELEEGELEEGEIEEEGEIATGKNHRPKIPSLLDMDTSRLHNVVDFTTDNPNLMPPPASHPRHKGARKPRCPKGPLTVSHLAMTIEGQIRHQLAYLEEMRERGISETAALAAQNSALVAKYAPPEEEVMIPPPPMPPCVIPGEPPPEKKRLQFEDDNSETETYKDYYNYYNQVVNKYNSIMFGEKPEQGGGGSEQHMASPAPPAAAQQLPPATCHQLPAPRQQLPAPRQQPPEAVAMVPLPPHSQAAMPPLPAGEPPPQRRQQPPPVAQLPRAQPPPVSVPQQSQLPPQMVPPPSQVAEQPPPQHKQLPPQHQQLPPQHQQLPPQHQQLPPQHQQLPPQHQQLPPQQQQQQPPSQKQLPPADTAQALAGLDPEQTAAYEEYLQKYHAWEQEMADYEEQMRLYRLQYPEAAAAAEAAAGGGGQPQPPPPGVVAHKPASSAPWQQQQQAPPQRSSNMMAAPAPGMPAAYRAPAVPHTSVHQPPTAQPHPPRGHHPLPPSSHSQPPRPHGDHSAPPRDYTRPPPREHPMPPREHPMPSREHPMPPREHPMPSREHPMPSREHPMPSREHPMPSREHPMPPREHPMPSREHPMPSREHPMPPRDYAGPPRDHNLHSNSAHPGMKPGPPRGHMGPSDGHGVPPRGPAPRGHSVAPRGRGAPPRHGAPPPRNHNQPPIDPRRDQASLEEQLLAEPSSGISDSLSSDYLKSLRQEIGDMVKQAREKSDSGELALAGAAGRGARPAPSLLDLKLPEPKASRYQEEGLQTAYTAGEECEDSWQQSEHPGLLSRGVGGGSRGRGGARPASESEESDMSNMYGVMTRDYHHGQAVGRGQQASQEDIPPGHSYPPHPHAAQRGRGGQARGRPGPERGRPGAHFQPRGRGMPPPRAPAASAFHQGPEELFTDEPSSSSLNSMPSDDFQKVLDDFAAQRRAKRGRGGGQQAAFPPPPPQHSRGAGYEGAVRPGRGGRPGGRGGRMGRGGGRPSDMDMGRAGSGLEHMMGAMGEDVQAAEGMADSSQFTAPSSSSSRAPGFERKAQDVEERRLAARDRNTSWQDPQTVSSRSLLD